MERVLKLLKGGAGERPMIAPLASTTNSRPFALNGGRDDYPSEAIPPRTDFQQEPPPWVSYKQSRGQCRPTTASQIYIRISGEPPEASVWQTGDGGGDWYALSNDLVLAAIAARLRPSPTQRQPERSSAADQCVGGVFEAESSP